MKDFFEVKDTKALGKGKGRPGKQKSRENQDTEADEGDMGDGDEDAERASIAKAPIGVIADDKTVDELREEVTFVEGQIKDVLRSLGKGASANDWLAPWRRSRKIFQDDNRPIRIIDMINYHTQEWANINPKSVSRLRRDVISAAITEYCAVTAYREELLDDISGGFAYVRATLERAVSTCLKEGAGQPAHHSEDYVYPDGRRLSSRTLSWPDGIKFQSHLATRKFDFSEHQARIVRTRAMEKQTDVLQRVVASVQKCELSWKVPHADKKKAHPLQQEVQDALQNLVDARIILI